MITPTKDSLRDNLSIIWAIAWKDILDALKNKVVISMIIMLSLILIIPKMLPYIFEAPQTVTIPIHDMDGSSLISILDDTPGISVQKVRSEQEFDRILCGGVNPLMGLSLPANFDQLVDEIETVEVQGYVCWSMRHKVADVGSTLEGILSQHLGRSVTIHYAGNFVYPPSDGALPLSLATLNSVVLILMMGIFLVPSLILEEKETRTLQAMLVSPASISQVVIGKALAGAFYILVTAVIMFAISWAEVTHWGTVIIFVLSGGIFSVALGLVLGSFFEKQQDIVGWMTLLIVMLVGSIFLRMIGTELPAAVDIILSWVPSVALTEISLASFSETISITRIWVNLGIVLAVSLPLYLLVIWKIRMSDR